MVVLAGPMATGSPYWPPSFPFCPGLPLEDDPHAGDEKLLRPTVTALGLDAKGYRDLIDEARDRWLTPEYGRLEHAISYALEQFSVLNQAQFERVVAIVDNHSSPRSNPAWNAKS